MVIKPAELTPLTALAAAGAAQRAGMPWGAQRRHGRQRAVRGRRQGTVRQRRGAPPVVHRLDRVGFNLMAQCAPTVKSSPGTGRQCPLHRVRRCRHRQRRGRRFRQQVPQRGPIPAYVPTVFTCRRR
ncbi:MAG: hypothetical protein U1E74_02975 [Paenacidovorax caeni]